MSKSKVPVTIDTREDSGVAEELGGYFIRHEDISDVDFEELSSGDIGIAGVGFERKTPSDFASSLMEGRLKDQAKRMCAEYEHCYILIEGSVTDFDYLSHTDIPPKSLRGAAASVTARYCPVLFTGDHINGSEENRQLLTDMAMRLARKHIEKEGKTFVKGAVTDTSLSPAERVAGSLEGVGPELAERMSSAFDNPRQISNASKSDLKRVDGIGDGLADSIYDQLNGQE